MDSGGSLMMSRYIEHQAERLDGVQESMAVAGDLIEALRQELRQTRHSLAEAHQKLAQGDETTARLAQLAADLASRDAEVEALTARAAQAEQNAEAALTASKEAARQLSEQALRFAQERAEFSRQIEALARDKVGLQEALGSLEQQRAAEAEDNALRSARTKALLTEAGSKVDEACTALARQAAQAKAMAAANTLQREREQAGTPPSRSCRPAWSRR